MVIAAMLLFAAACGDDDDSDAGGDDGGDATEEVEALAVSAVDYAFEGLPEEIPGGVVEIAFSNDGEAEHEIAFVEVGDVEPDQFFTDFAPYIEGGGPPHYVTNFVGANEAAPVMPPTSPTRCRRAATSPSARSTSVPGADPESEEAEEGPPHFTQGMQQIVTVTAEEGDAELPDADGTITATDYDFEVDLEAGDTTINFTNDGPDQPHFAGFDRYEEGTTPEEAVEAFGVFFTLEDGQAPPEGTLEGEEVAFSGVATPGNGIGFELPNGLEPGTYVFYCFLSDRAGGPPHALPPDQGGKGMVKAFTVE